MRNAGSHTRRARRQLAALGVVAAIAAVAAPTALADGGLPGLGSTVSVPAAQPVTDAVTQTTAPVTQAFAPVTTPVVTATAPVTNAVTQTTAPVTNEAAQATAPVAPTVAKATEQPVQTVTQAAVPVVETVADVTEAPVQTATQAASPVVETAATAAEGPVQTVTQAAAPVLETVEGATAVVTEPVATLTGTVTTPLVETTTARVENTLGSASGTRAATSTLAGMQQATGDQSAGSIIAGDTPLSASGGIATATTLITPPGIANSALAPFAPYPSPDFATPPDRALGVITFPSAPVGDVRVTSYGDSEPMPSSRPHRPSPDVPSRDLTAIFSGSTSAGGAGALVILLATLAAGFLLAAPGLGRRLRPRLAPWPRPILQLSLERPG